MTTIAVIGLGYVGLPLAVAFGRTFRTVGFDLSQEKIAAYQTGFDPTGEVTREDFRTATHLSCHTDPAVVREADFVIVAVPTPVDQAHQPDFTLLQGDLTRAYSDKVKQVQRSFVFLNLGNAHVPAALVVFDRVISANPEFRKFWLLHMLEEPRVSNNRAIVDCTQHGASGRLTLDVLLPPADNAQLTAIGGPGKEFWVFGKNYPADVDQDRAAVLQVDALLDRPGQQICLLRPGDDLDLDRGRRANPVDQHVAVARPAQRRRRDRPDVLDVQAVAGGAEATKGVDHAGDRRLRHLTGLEHLAAEPQGQPIALQDRGAAAGHLRDLHAHGVGAHVDDAEARRHAHGRAP